MSVWNVHVQTVSVNIIKQQGLHTDIETQNLITVSFYKHSNTILVKGLTLILECLSWGDNYLTFDTVW
jgi:hypothetical protein